jgi:putative phosphoesterase
VSSKPVPYRIGVLADTHGYLAPRLFELLEGVGLILHAGDLGGEGLLAELEAIAPTLAVVGNMDGPARPDRPLVRRVETPAGRVAMTHGHLPQAPARNLNALMAHFRPSRPDIIVFGHTHRPHLSRRDGVWLFNPGSAGRGEPGQPPTLGLITVAQEGDKPRFEHLPL